MLSLSPPYSQHLDTHGARILRSATSLSSLLLELGQEKPLPRPYPDTSHKYIPISRPRKIDFLQNAVVCRTKLRLNALAAEIINGGGEADAFPIESYDYTNALALFNTYAHTQVEQRGPRFARRCATLASWCSKLGVTEQDLAPETWVGDALAFLRGAILGCKDNGINEKGRRRTARSYGSIWMPVIVLEALLSHTFAWSTRICLRERGSSISVPHMRSGGLQAERH